jgi:lipopolysaccharide export system permease protein
MAKSGEWITWLGVWLSTIILLPIGAFLTYKANKDSVVFNIEAYITIFRKAFGLRIARNIARKDVIIHDPNYPQVRQGLVTLIQDWQNYSHKMRLRFPPNYFRIFFKNLIDEEVVGLSERMEQFIIILSNSKDHAILSGLNKLPILNLHAHTRPFINYKWNMALGILLPLGLFFYFRIWFFRIRLYKDIKTIQKYGQFIIERIDKITNENK